MSNFEKVVEFNRVFGVPISNEIQKDIFTQNQRLVELRMKLIREEMKELEEAVKNHDMTETIDALSDILYVVYGAGASFGIDMDKSFDMVHRSNMTKACPTEEVANKTVKWYQDNSNDYNSKNPDQAPVDPQIRELNNMYVVYNKTTGKVLKSVDYEPVNFSSM